MAKAIRGLRKLLLRRLENYPYRISGLPITLRALLGRSEPASARQRIRLAYARQFWAPNDWREGFDLALAIVTWPIALLLLAILCTWQNGRAIRERSGRSPLAQFLDQLQLYLTDGILPPWYYIFSLYEPGGKARAGAFIQRCETKRSTYPLLMAARHSVSPLGDKVAFADHCQRCGLAVVPVLASACDGMFDGRSELPDRDLFIKPVDGRGGRGAERWDFVGEGRYRRPDGREMTRGELRRHICRRSRAAALLIQPRMINHSCVIDLSNGALSTVRALTCLDEDERPEVVAAVLRMAIGANCTVDNIHAGGIAAAIDLESGQLTSASNLGTDERLGWFDTHPQTGGEIADRVLPRWQELRQLAVDAHRAFIDWAVIGWDIAITSQGLMIVEGNYGPDVDLMQRPLRRGLGDQRFGELFARLLERHAVI